MAQPSVSVPSLIFKCIACGISVPMRSQDWPLRCVCGLVATEPEPTRWIRNTDRARATIKLAGMLPSTITAVAGVSRSGISSALQICELLHLHPFSISMQCELTPLTHGYRFNANRRDDGDLLIVDDTVASGRSMKHLQKSIGRIARPKIWHAVTYASPQASGLVDFYAERLNLPHYLEWNFFNSTHSPATALDFDGVLCRECQADEDDDGPKYLRFLETAEPLYLPRRCPVPLIVTARLEKYRPQTEAWLAKWGVVCRKLVMGPWSTLAERRAHYSAAEHKGQAYKKSQCLIFVESCPRQAKQIAQESGKRVICPATAEIFN